MEAKRQSDASRFASDLRILECLYEVGNRCVRVGNDLHRNIESILDAAILITGADKGNVQLYQPEQGALVIVAQRGFEQPFLDFFSHVNDQSAAACGAAMSRIERVVVEDVTRSELFVGQPALDILLAENVRAVQSTPLVSSSGKVLGMISTHFRQPTHLTDHVMRFMDLLARQSADYLERKQSEDVFRAKEAQLETVANNAPVLLTQCSRDLRYTYVNEAYARFIGEPVERIIGRPIIDILGEAAFGIIRPYIERVLTGEQVEYEHEIPWPTGRRYIHCVYVPQVDSKNEVRGWFATITDLTDRRKAEQKLREADRQKDQFLAMLSHELRNPLAPLRNSLELLARRFSGDPEASQPMAIAQRQTDQLMRLVDDLLDVSRIAQGRITLQQEEVELGEVVDDAVEQVLPLLQQRNHRLEVSRGAARLFVRGDKARLIQSVANLLHNAAKYTERAGEIRVSIGHAGSRVRLQITDNGIGMGPELLPRVFDLFSQGDRTLDRAEGGLGIGLSIVKQIIELHHGTIRAESAGVGQGATFIVEIPKIDARAVAHLEPETSSKVWAKRVLVIDDNVDAADSLAMLLKFEGHEAKTAYTAIDALEEARRFKPHAVLVDIGLPHIHGYELARRLRELPELNRTVLIALTGYGQSEDRVRSAAVGFSHHLVKPADLKELAQILSP